MAKSLRLIIQRIRRYVCPRFRYYIIDTAFSFDRRTSRRVHVSFIRRIQRARITSFFLI